MNVESFNPVKLVSRAIRDLFAGDEDAIARLLNLGKKGKLGFQQFDCTQVYYDTVINGRVRLLSRTHVENEPLDGEFLITSEGKTNLADTAWFFGAHSLYMAEATEAFSNFTYLYRNVLSSSRFPHGGYFSWPGEKSAGVCDNAQLLAILRAWKRKIPDLPVPALAWQSMTRCAVISLIDQACTRVMFLLKNCFEVQERKFHAGIICDKLGGELVMLDDEYACLTNFSWLPDDNKTHLYVLLCLPTLEIVSEFSVKHRFRLPFELFASLNVDEVDRELYELAEQKLFAFYSSSSKRVRKMVNRVFGNEDKLEATIELFARIAAQLTEHEGFPLFDFPKLDATPFSGASVEVE